MKKNAFILILSMLLLMLTSCLPSEYENVADTPDSNLPAPESAEELYSMYNAVERGMTAAELEAKLGSGEPVYDEFGRIKYLNYFNDKKSAGVTVIYDGDVVLTKTLYFNTKRNLVPFSGRFDESKIPLIKNDMTVSAAKEVMGSMPLEISCNFLPDGPLSTKKIYCWYNEDASSFMIHTENDLVSNVVLHRN